MVLGRALGNSTAKAATSASSRRTAKRGSTRRSVGSTKPRARAKPKAKGAGASSKRRPARSKATSGSRGKSASKSASKVCFAGRAVYQPANSQLWRTACAIAYGPLGDNQKPVWWKVIPERPVGDFVEPRCVAQACGTCGAFLADAEPRRPACTPKKAYCAVH